MRGKKRLWKKKGHRKGKLFLLFKPSSPETLEFLHWLSKHSLTGICVSTGIQIETEQGPRNVFQHTFRAIETTVCLERSSEAGQTFETP